MYVGGLDIGTSGCKVVVFDDKGNLISKTANSVVSETCSNNHAEMNAIISASRNEMLGADLYLSGYRVMEDNKLAECEAWPCEICLRLIKNAGIDRIINSRGVIYTRAENSNLLLQLIEKESK